MSTKKLQIVSNLITTDKTLTQGGFAADAKVVGDAVNTLNTSVENIPQPDWNQTDETQKDFIKNKPEDLAHASDIPGIDATLSTEGDAADAKAVGDAITNINSLIGEESVSAQIANAIASIPQADWNQNDPNAPDYVKNRTHWEEGVILPETEMTKVEQDGNDPMYIAKVLAMPEEGKVYTVVYNNGTPLDCTCALSEVDPGSFILAMGADETNPDVPFALFFDEVDEMGEVVVCYPVDGSTPTTLSIVEKDATVHKLDPKFMHETVVMAERPELTSEVVILPETELESGDDGFYLTAPLSATPTEGATALINYNGVEYACTIAFVTDDGISAYIMGNMDAVNVPIAGGNPDAPFVILLDPNASDGVYGNVIPLDESITSITISIIQKTASVPQQLVMDKDGNIKWEDRTHWVEGGIVEILPETIIAEASDEALEALFATPFTQSIVAGKTYLVSYCGTTYVCVGTSYTGDGITAVCLGNLGALGASGGNPDAPFIMYEIPDEMTETFSGAAWMLEPITEDGYPLPLIIGIKCNDEIVHKIDNKFLDIAPSNWNALPGTPGHIENRTHYCDHVVMTYDPTKLAGVDTLTVDFGSGNPITFYKIGDYALDAAALEASSYTITALSTGEQSTTTVTVAQDNNGVSTGMAPAFFICSIHDLAAASESGVVAPSTGTYIFVISEEPCAVTVDAGEIIKKLDEKYLPEKEEINSNLINGIAEGSLRAINTNVESDTYSLGDDSVALNTGTAASGISSFSTGVNTKAAGNGSHAEGYATKATGEYSHSEGYSTVAKGKHSHSEGYSTQIAVKLTGAAYATQYKCNIARDWSPYIGGIIEYNGITAVVLNMVDVTTLALSTTLSSDGLTDTEVIIHTGVAFDEVAHSEGVGTLAFGISSHAEGTNTQAIGRNSHAEGQYASAEADCSHAEGFSTKALGIYSHAEGKNTQTFGRSQLVIGEKNKFSTQVRYSDTTAPDSFIWLPATGGNLSNLFRKLSGIHTSINRLGVYVFDSMELVEDYTTLAIGDCFVTAGAKPETIKRYYELVSPINYENDTFTAEIIEHTVSDNYLERGEYVFVIGNGDPTIANSRSNAHAVDWDGNAYFAGDVYVQGDGTTFEFDGKKKLATESYVDSKIPTPEDALALMIEMGFVDPVADETGAMYTDDNGKIFTY